MQEGDAVSISAGSFVMNRISDIQNGRQPRSGRNPQDLNQFLFGGLASPEIIKSLRSGEPPVNAVDAAGINIPVARPPVVPAVQASGLDALAVLGRAQVNFNNPNPNNRDAGNNVSPPAVAPQGGAPQGGTKEGRIQSELDLQQRQYKVQSGDTLSHIARAVKNQYGLRQPVNEIVDKLAAANGIRDKNLIFPDQDIKFDAVLTGG